MTVYVADAHAHVQRLVSVVKMVTVSIEKCTAEEQRSVMRSFCEQKDSMQRILIKKCFLFLLWEVFVA
jgi:hypothetical protein